MNHGDETAGEGKSMSNGADQISDAELFSSLTSDEPVATASDNTSASQEQAPDSDARSRDEKGRFAAKGGDDADEGGQASSDEQSQPEKGRVPSSRLKEEAEARRRAEKELSEARALLMEMQKASLRQMQPAQQQQVEEKPDFWSDPEAFINRALEQRLVPVQQQVTERNLAISEMQAVKDYGHDTVKSAYDALGSYVQSSPAAQHDYYQIMQSPHPFDALVKWHQRASAMAEIGTDPEGYRKKLEEEIRAKVLSEMKQTGQHESSNSVVRLPSLNRMTSAASGSQSSSAPSDAELFAQLTRR